MINRKRGTFLAIQWLRLYLLMQWLWVESIVGDLRSHMVCGQRQNHKTEEIL